MWRGSHVCNRRDGDVGESGVAWVLRALDGERHLHKPVIHLHDGRKQVDVANVSESCGVVIDGVIRWIW